MLCFIFELYITQQYQNKIQHKPKKKLRPVKTLEKITLLTLCI